MTLVQTNICKIRDKSDLCAKKIFPENCVPSKSEAESVLSNVLKNGRFQPKRAYKARA